MIYGYELERLAKLNNRAAALLNDKEYSRAISLFGRALSLARNMVAHTNEQVSEGPPLAAMSFDLCMKASQNAFSKDLDRNDFKEAGPYLYQQPLLVPTKIPHVQRSHTLMSVILIFNTALAYHMVTKQLLDESLPNEHFVRKSIQLYHLAYTLCDDETCGSSPNFFMAIANNLGLLYQENHCTDKAHTCFEHLLSTLLYLVDSCQAEDLDEGYFENTAHLIFKEKENSLAPAA